MSPGVVTSWSDSMRQVVSSGVSQLWLLKQTTFHRIRRYTANGFEGQGTSCYFEGRRPGIQTALLLLSLLRPLFFDLLKNVSCLIDLIFRVHDLWISSIFCFCFIPLPWMKVSLSRKGK